MLLTRDSKTSSRAWKRTFRDSDSVRIPSGCYTRIAYVRTYMRKLQNHSDQFKRIRENPFSCNFMRCNVKFREHSENLDIENYMNEIFMLMSLLLPFFLSLSLFTWERNIVYIRQFTQCLSSVCELRISLRGRYQTNAKEIQLNIGLRSNENGEMSEWERIRTEEQFWWADCCST